MSVIPPEDSTGCRAVRYYCEMVSPHSNLLRCEQFPLPTSAMKRFQHVKEWWGEGGEGGEREWTGLDRGDWTLLWWLQNIKCLLTTIQSSSGQGRRGEGEVGGGDIVNVILVPASLNWANFSDFVNLRGGLGFSWGTNTHQWHHLCWGYLNWFIFYNLVNKEI